MARHRSDTQRMQLMRDLELEQAEVKTLRGLLPICACCKGIRDDAGYWHGVEAYISAHSEATFTHGYCPACEREALAEIGHAAKSVPKGQAS